MDSSQTKSSRRVYALLLLTLAVMICHAKNFTKDFTIQQGKTIYLSMPKDVKPVVTSAVEMFTEDVNCVFGGNTIVIKTDKNNTKNNTKSNTKGNTKNNTKSKATDIQLSYDTSLPREGFYLYVHNGKLSIKGADDHGLAYGLLELSRKIGVSPWIYWADCIPEHKESFTLEEGYDEQQQPAVAFRGIFINDEDWGMNPWATRNEPEAWTLHRGRVKGAVGPETNEKIFQLLLRLRANYYWPAMHECSQPFFTIKGNREMAKKYGIYIGGSHCEPMATSPAVEWELNGHGDYNYATNRDSVLAFWRERIGEVKDQEMVYTLGMRGVHDGAMQGAKTMEDKLKYLQMVIDDQREMLRQELKDEKAVPQVFIPYKEVLDIYHNGLQVPDDVTLMWTDDNYGYIRHFPDSLEARRPGGNGLYYHLSYWGRPHDYLWLNSMPPQVMVPQLTEAYQRNIRGIWVANVGDLKPGECQTELFMDMAWKGCYDIRWYDGFYTREFGNLGNRIAKVMSEYYRLMNDCKPEFLAGTRTEEQDKAYWNTIRKANDDWTKSDVAKRVNRYKTISDQVEQLSTVVPRGKKDAFYQLVKYPVQGAAQMNFKFLCPDKCCEAYDSIQSLTHYYNKQCAGGKWDGIMSSEPRNLPVFKKVKADELPEYPDSTELTELHFSNGAYECITPIGTDSVTLEIRVLPHHPVIGDKIAFTVSANGNEPMKVDYQTYGRSEEWKQNVLRGYAKRIVRIAVDKNKTHQTIRLAMPDGTLETFGTLETLDTPGTFGTLGTRIFLIKNLAD